MDVNAIIFESLTIWSFVKIMILALIVLYLVFAFVIVRQEQLMNRVVEVGGNGILRLLALVHFGAAVTLFFVALLFL